MWRRGEEKRGEERRGEEVVKNFSEINASFQEVLLQFNKSS
jgi:hypothetical protein